MEEKGWEKWKNWLPKGFKWGVQHARRKNRKGRAIGGMLMGRKEASGERKGDRSRGGGLIVGNIRWGKERWRVIGVYVGGGIED